MDFAGVNVQLEVSLGSFVETGRSLGFGGLRKNALALECRIAAFEYHDSCMASFLQCKRMLKSRTHEP